MLGGPLGTLIGGVLGHGLDRGMDLLKGYMELGPEAHEERFLLHICSYLDIPED